MAETEGKSFVSYELRGNVALIGLTRPEKRNAISDAVIEELALVIERARNEAKAAVIFGEGQHFCAGLDLAEHSEKPLLDLIMARAAGTRSSTGCSAAPSLLRGPARRSRRRRLRAGLLLPDPRGG